MRSRKQGWNSAIGLSQNLGDCVHAHGTPSSTSSGVQHQCRSRGVDRGGLCLDHCTGDLGGAECLPQHALSSGLGNGTKQQGTALSEKDPAHKRSTAGWDPHNARDPHHQG